MITTAVHRLASLGVWPAPVPAFLLRPTTLQWLADVQRQSGRTDDEIVLLLLAALRSLELTLLDGGTDEARVDAFFGAHEAEVRRLCLLRRVQANVAERALPVLELLARRWRHQRLVVTELGSSFGLLGRVLVHAPQTLRGFDRYFAPNQQKPTDVPLVVQYQGIDLSPPDERWLLACIPLQPLRSRVARFIYEVPAGANCRVTAGSALDTSLWLVPSAGEIPVVLTSFMLYQLPDPVRNQLVGSIREFIQHHGGSWVNLDVLTPGEAPRFVVQEDGVDRLVLENDFCQAWRYEG